MNMKKKIVTVCLVACMALTAVAGGTLAYFTDEAKKDNTFTVGNVDIELTETGDWNTPEYEGVLVPSKPIDKDPTITVQEGSEDAYIFADIDLSVQFADLMEACGASEINDAVIKEWFDIQDGWTFKKYEKGVATYAYDNTVTKESEPVKLFTQVTPSSKIDNDMKETADGAKVTITAKAIQADGFEEGGVEAAYKALYKIAE